MTLGWFIKKFRMENMLTQKQACEKLKISFWLFNYIENDKAFHLTQTTLQKIAAGTNTELKEIREMYDRVKEDEQEAKRDDKNGN